MLAPSSQLAAQASRQGMAPEPLTSVRPRPAARAGPTIYEAVVPLVERSSRVGPALAAGLRRARTGFR